MLAEPASARLLGNLDAGFSVAGIMCWIELVIACHGCCCDSRSFVATSVFHVAAFQYLSLVDCNFSTGGMKELLYSIMLR